MSFLVLTAEHGDVYTVLGNSLTILVSFVILLAILSKFAIGPVLKMMEQREQTVNTQLDEAKMLKDKAKMSEQEAKETVHTAQLQAQQIVSKAKESGDKIKDEARQQAKLDGLKIRQDAQVAMDNERELMLQDLTMQVGDMASELAKKLLKREITLEDHQKLIDDFIEGLDN